jgi:predicted phosphodiesterase
MAAIGVFSDSHGDLKAFDAAYELLKSKGARRFVFAGGRYSDLDEWVLWKKNAARGGRDYSDLDFLADVSAFLSDKEQVDRPPAFDEKAPAPEPQRGENYDKVKDKFVRAPEKDSLAYRDPNIARKSVDMVGDVLCCVVYDKNDLDREDLLNASIFIHGKEGEPKVVQIGPRFFITPGKLTGAADQTVGLLETQEKKLVFSAFTLEGKAIFSGKVLVAGGGPPKTKLSVK